MVEAKINLCVSVSMLLQFFVYCCFFLPVGCLFHHILLM